MYNDSPNIIPLKVLLRLNSKLFLAFLLGALLITSLHDWSFHGIHQRVLAMSTLFIIIFLINIFIFHYLDKRRKNKLDKIWGRTFILGYLISFIYYNFHIKVTMKMVDKGLYELPKNGFEIDNFTGIQYFTFAIVSSLIIYSFIFFVQNTVLTQYEKNQIQLELLQLESSNTDAVNQLLRQQIQPHFLFNTLNILKTLIRRDKQKAEEYLLHLSNFLRVSITENKSGISTLESELKICNDYMEMQKIRFGNALFYEVNIPNLDEIKEKKLPFFSLQALLENAIKHNTLTIEKPLHITVSSTENSQIRITNNLQRKKIPKEASTGNGLHMLFERYRIINEQLPTIEEDENSFSITLKIFEE